jgi:hypothetical protein
MEECEEDMDMEYGRNNSGCGIEMDYQSSLLEANYDDLKQIRQE